MAAKPAPRKARVIIDPYEVAVALDALGITNDLLHEAVRRGHLDRVFASPLDFAGRGEYVAASTALRTICEGGGKLSASWHRANHLSIPVAFNLDRSIAIAVTSGDEYTGIDGASDPKTRPEKGPNTERAIAQTFRFSRRADDEEDWGVDLYYLLTYPDGERVRMELSRSAVVENGHVNGWHERIILGGVDLSGFDRRPVPSEPVAPTDITPVRKSG